MSLDRSKPGWYYDKECIESVEPPQRGDRVKCFGSLCSRKGIVTEFDGINYTVSLDCGGTGVYAGWLVYHLHPEYIVGNL